jgi:hypothetical protein
MGHMGDWDLEIRVGSWKRTQQFHLQPAASQTAGIPRKYALAACMGLHSDDPETRLGSSMNAA